MNISQELNEKLNMICNLNFFTTRYSSQLKKMKMKSGNRGFSCCCPFHDENNPSFSVDTKEGKILYFCHTCGARGTGFNLYKYMEGIDSSSEAVKKLISESGIVLADTKHKEETRDWSNFADLFHRILNEPGNVHAYNMAKSYDFNSRMIYQFMLGFCPRYKKFQSQEWMKPLLDRLIIPIRGTDKKVKGFHSRCITNVDEEVRSLMYSKYLNNTGFQKHLYLFDTNNYSNISYKDKTGYDVVFKGPEWINRKDAVILVEGPKDAMLLGTLGFRAIATFGVSFTDDQLSQISNLIRSGLKLYILYDSDKHGRKAQLDMIKRMDNDLLEHVYLTFDKWVRVYGGKDMTDLLKRVYGSTNNQVEIVNNLLNTLTKASDINLHGLFVFDNDTDI